jgi:hypothetical protein
MQRHPRLGCGRRIGTDLEFTYAGSIILTPDINQFLPNAMISGSFNDNDASGAG